MPDELRRLTKLRQLSLTYLDIGDHKIDALPEDYRDLPLKALRIASTKIKKLPDLGPSLERITAFYAPLEQLGNIGRLPAFQMLELRLSRKLKALPEGEWPAMRFLDLDSLPMIRELPPALLRSSTLEHIVINGCPELELPDDVDWPNAQRVIIRGVKRAPAKYAA